MVSSFVSVNPHLTIFSEYKTQEIQSFYAFGTMLGRKKSKSTTTPPTVYSFTPSLNFQHYLKYRNSWKRLYAECMFKCDLVTNMKDLPLEVPAVMDAKENAQRIIASANVSVIGKPVTKDKDFNFSKSLTYQSSLSSISFVIDTLNNSPTLDTHLLSLFCVWLPDVIRSDTLRFGKGIYMPYGTKVAQQGGGGGGSGGGGGGGGGKKGGDVSSSSFPPPPLPLPSPVVASSSSTPSSTVTPVRVPMVGEQQEEGRVTSPSGLKPPLSSPSATLASSSFLTPQLPGLGLGSSIVSLDLRESTSPLFLYISSLSCPFVEFVDIRGLVWLNTPALIRLLRICSRLKEVRLRGTGVPQDDEGLNALIDARPTLLVNWD